MHQSFPNLEEQEGDITPAGAVLRPVSCFEKAKTLALRGQGTVCKTVPARLT